MVFVSSHNSPGVFPSCPGAPVAPVFGANTPTEQGPTLNKVDPESSAKNKPGWVPLIFTAGCPSNNLAGSGRLFNTSERRSFTGVTRFVAIVCE